MRENSLGANIVSPHGDQFIQVSSGFVDDITHWCIHMDSGHSAEDLVEQYLMRHMQDTAQLWEQLLYLTGGKLELSKCFYYPITWSFDSEGAAHLVPPNQLKATITLEDSESKQSFHIATKPCHEAHKTLGVMEQPDGNNTAEFNRLLKKATNHAQILAGSILKYEETETYYFAIYLPSMNISGIGVQQQDSLDDCVRASVFGWHWSSASLRRTGLS
jgi:hypothetical protein